MVPAYNYSSPSWDLLTSSRATNKLVSSGAIWISQTLLRTAEIAWQADAVL
jgi:hypothetical protein